MKVIIRWIGMRILRLSPCRTTVLEIRYKNNQPIIHHEFWSKWWASTKDINNYRDKTIAKFAAENGIEVDEIIYQDVKYRRQF